MYQISDLKESEANLRHSGESRNPVFVAYSKILDFGSVIPDLIRDRNDGIFTTLWI